MAAFVVLLVAVWGLGFAWFRGDLTGTPAKAQARSETAGQPAARSTEAAEPSPTVTPRARAPYTGKVTEQQERQPVDINPTELRPRPVAIAPVLHFVMATFNLLGSSHSKHGGSAASFAPGPNRMPGALRILAEHQVTVVGFQEFQPNQRATFQRLAKGWQMYPGLSLGRRAGENSVAWRSDTWEMVRPGLIPIPYFNGRIRPMPYVLLRNKQTGVQAYFSTFHNPANIGGNMQRWRSQATTREARLFNQLEKSGIPQLVTGDMNERQEYFCRITAETPLVAAAGGSNNGGCAPPRPIGIDWIFGSPGVQWSSYTVDRSPLVRRTTDHPVVIATATIDAVKWANAYVPDVTTATP
jgi:hypothetical protein